MYNQRVALGLAGGLAAWLAACGSDPHARTSTGTGTQTLRVEAQIEWNVDRRAADIHVLVERAGQSVGDAVITIHSDLGELTLGADATEPLPGMYVGEQPGWASYYALEVVAGTDGLSASIAAPDLMTLLAPVPTVAVDARTLPDNVMTVRWSGDLADSIRVKSGDFDHRGADEGEVEMPAMTLEDELQQLELRRDNSIRLAGGVAGSSLTATCKNEFMLAVTNPF